MKRGEIYWVSLNPTQGHEQSGIRPVVVSPEAFNCASGVPIVLPITTDSGFAQRIGFAVLLDDGLPITGLIRCDQPCALNINQRGGKYAATLPPHLIDEMLAKVQTLFA